MSIEELYEQVFDEQGNVKPCGRRVCQELMMACEKIIHEPCGDKENGFMNVEKVKEAYRKYLITKAQIEPEFPTPQMEKAAAEFCKEFDEKVMAPLREGQEPSYQIITQVNNMTEGCD